jgi:four helix bundle protein
MQPYQRFAAWQTAHQLAIKIYEVTARWPSRERYGLTAQLRRAALAVPTNMVEGSAKRGKRELGRFLDISVGSVAEVSYLLLFAREIGLLSTADWTTLEALREKAAQQLWLLYRAVRGA